MRKKREYNWRKYTLNEDYFEKIDTEDKAYFLGLLYADGSHNERLYCITLSLVEKDIEILNAFNSCVGSNRPLGTTHKNGCEKCQMQKVLCLNSIKLSEDLAKLGCTQAKTHTTKFPDIDEKFYSHFIRGVFDGDGSLTGKRHPQFSIVGNAELLLKIQEILMINCKLNKTKLHKRHKERENDIRTLCYTGGRTCIRLYDYLYKNAIHFLTRKKERFEQVFTEKNYTEEIKQNPLIVGKITTSNTKFPYKMGDIVMFPDTESEYVDVEIGQVQVSEVPINTICEVRPKGKGHRLKILPENWYSEIFRRSRGKYISLQEYLDYFGNYDELIKIK